MSQLEPRRDYRLSGLFSFRGVAQMLGGCRAISSYWCTPDRVIGDPRGTVLPSDEAAIGTARTIIDDLLEDSGPGQPRPIIMVRNEAGEIIYQFPSN